MKAKNDNYVQQNASFLSLNTVLDNNPNRSDMNKFNNVNISICNHNYGNNLYSLQLMQKNAILMHQERNSDLFGYICGIVNIINSKDDNKKRLLHELLTNTRLVSYAAKGRSPLEK